ncbi:hypothetical protein [Paraburkholderia sp. SIMBA_054]|uniref:hypothetical protein n=1 Tax=Paraburkholderia sp. SIMBA_054 TaxID=3085795 RepID=UPI00397C14E4
MGLFHWGLLAAAVVCYVHRAIPKFTATAARRTGAHGVLLLTGCAFGIVTALTPRLDVPQWLAFVAGFGAVDVPAAAILLVKDLRGSGRS